MKVEWSGLDALEMGSDAYPHFVAGGEALDHAGAALPLRVASSYLPITSATANT